VKTRLLIVFACALLAGCGGSASTNTLGTSATLSVDTTAAAQNLQQIATQAQTLISSQLQQISTSTSSADASARLAEAQTKVESLATQLDDVQTDNPNLARARDELHDALHSLAGQLGQLKQSVESGNLQQAVQQLSSSTALADVQQAVQDLQSQAG
jgi:chromosome segregation ATPase